MGSASSSSVPRPHTSYSRGGPTGGYTAGPGGQGRQGYTHPGQTGATGQARANNGSSTHTIRMSAADLSGPYPQYPSPVYSGQYPGTCPPQYAPYEVVLLETVGKPYPTQKYYGLAPPPYQSSHHGQPARPSSPFEAHAQAATADREKQQQYPAQQPPGTGFTPEVIPRPYTPQGHQQAPPQYPGQQGGDPAYPPQQMPQPPQHHSPGHHPQPPGEAGTGEWSERRDMIFSRILSADEFLGRMDETDDKLSTLSSLEPAERESFQGRIEDLLGLRGHLQDELLRIQAMFTDEDPELHCLQEFAGSFPRVVQKIYELREKARMIPVVKVETIDIQTEDGESGISIQSTGTDTGTGSRSTGEMGTQASRTSMVSAGTGNDSDEEFGILPNGPRPKATTFSIKSQQLTDSEVVEKLKAKHDTEEKDLAKDYAEKVVLNPEALSKAQMNALLSDHAFNMQALRKKQEAEKEKLQEILEWKKRDRLLKRRAGKQEAEEEEARKAHARDDVTSDVTESNSITNSTFVAGISSNKDETRPGSRDGRKPVGVASPMMTPGRGEVTDDTQAGKGRKASTTSSIMYPSDEDDSLGSDDDLENGEYEYSDDFEELSESEDEQERIKTTLQEDLWSTLRDKPHTTSEDLQKVIASFRAQEDSRKLLKDRDRGKHKESLLSKLAARRAAGNQDEGFQEEEEDEDSLSSRDRKSSADAAMETDTWYDDEIKQKDAEFARRMRERARYVTDEEYAEFLKRHLAEVEALRRKRQAEKGRLDAKLKDKLNRRKQGGNQESDSEDEDTNEETAEELRLKEEEFLEQVSKKHRNLALDPAEMQKLLDQYRREQQQIVKGREAAKAATDEKLKQKLEERKKKRANFERKLSKKMSNVDDQFIRGLQQMQDNGQITEEVFNSMLESYLSQIGNVKKSVRRRKKDQDQSSAREDANQLVKEHEENKKQINDMRKREKNMMDQRLQKRLQAKKNQKAAVSEG